MVESVMATAPESVSWERYSNAVSSVEIGKRVGQSLYLHRSAVPPSLGPLIRVAEELAGDPETWNVIKLHGDEPKLSLLVYDRFMEDGFPRLAASWTTCLDSNTASVRTYAPEANPPVLHRKELLLLPNDPRRAEFEALTRQAEEAGLFSDRAIIGHLLQWEEELAARGVDVEGNKLVPRTSRSDQVEVLRHRTALVRHGLSTPMQALWRHGFLDGQCKVFDYGCGRGDDVAALQARGLDVAGWDPHFRPDGTRVESDVVNLGFVLNVIEDLDERAEALRGAWKLTSQVLAVAALIGGRTAYEKHRLFRDGVLTSRGTFQKYYTQAELGEYVAKVIGREPIPVAPGVYFAFRTDEGEQAFLERKQRSRGGLLAKSSLPRPPRRRGINRRSRRPDRFERRAEFVEAFWNRVLELGRLPVSLEFEEESTLRDHLGTPKRVLQHCFERFGEEPFEEARARRMDDVSVYLALNLFERRRSFGALSPRLQADVKEFWGSYKTAVDVATQLLFSVGDAANIEAAAAAAHLGFYERGHALQLESQLINELPAVLRVYVGCAAKLYGDVQDADLLKIHTTSGKLTLLYYDDFYGKLLPELIERVKIDLRRQSINFYEYGEEFPSQLVYLKSRFMAESTEGYEEQVAFDDRLEETAPFDFSGFGPERQDFVAWLETGGSALLET